MASDYVTVSGDMWDEIAYKAMGGERYTHLLMAANAQHIETMIFPAGVELIIPDVPSESQAELPPWRLSDE